MMKSIARLFYHLARNTAFKNYRFYRLTSSEKGRILFYDRDRGSFFQIQSRGLIDSVTANQIYSNNEYNFDFIGRGEQVREIYRAILKSGKIPLIIDCGSNIGLSPQYFAKQYPEAKIVAVEPNLENHELSKVNSTGFANIDLVNAAIGARPGFVVIDNASADANAFKVNRIDTSDGIELKTIPGLIEHYPDTELFIVKVDIEGFEKDLFSENIDWIEDCHVLIVELHDWMLPRQANSANFLRAIGRYDRDFLFKGESVFSIRNGS